MIIWLYMLALVVVASLSVAIESWILAGEAVVMIIIAAAFIRKENVDEGTTVGFKLARKFACYAMEFRNHRFNDIGEVVTTGGSKTYGWCPLVAKLGGWIFYVRPFVSPAAYGETNDDADFGKGNQVFLGDIALQIDVLGAETVEPDGSNVPVEVGFLVRARIKRPYTWTFASPRDNVDKLKIALNGSLRRLIRSGSEADIQALGDGPELWHKLVSRPVNCEPQFKQFSQEWGLEIIENGVSVIGVDYPPAYQEAMMARKKAELNAAGKAAELYGPVKRGQDEYGLTRSEALTLRTQSLAAESGGYSNEKREIDITSGGAPITDPEFKGIATLVGAIGAAIAAAKGGGKNPPGNPGKNPGNNKIGAGDTSRKATEDLVDGVQ